jgi:hypothetical protein
MSPFVGRRRELAMLERRLTRVRRNRAGTAVAMRGRRQVGKSRLVQEFCDRSGLPYVFHSGAKGLSPTESVTAFMRDVDAGLAPPGGTVVPAAGSWPDAFRSLAAALPDEPAIVVLDELPWLAEQDPAFDGALQTAWDRPLSTRPVLLLLLGSDLHMMERLTAYDRPFYGRADAMVLEPLDPAETAEALDLPPAEAVDAHLVSGGLPGILRTWPRGRGVGDVVREECEDPASPLFGVPETTLLSEFPNPDLSRRVIEAVGGGDRTHAAIAAAAGGVAGPVPSGSLSPTLRRLVSDKRVLAVDEPLSVRAGKPALYRVADSNLRLWLAVLRPVADLARRGRPEAAFALFTQRWPSWRGRAVEPLVRAGLERADLPWDDVSRVGGWWNRQFDPDVDLVGADRGPVAGAVSFVGSVKWRDGPVGPDVLHDLLAALPDVPGAAPGRTGTVLVTRTAERAPAGFDLVWTASDIVAAWTR